MKTAAMILGAAMAVAGCARTTEAPRPAEALSYRASTEVVLDVAANGDALVGRELPAEPESDADRVLSPSWLTRAGRRPWRGGDVLEARWIPGTTAVLTITTAHTLTRRESPDAPAVELDREVFGPLSLDARGTAVAYTRGDPPMLSLVRLDLRTGVATAMAPGLVPAWCPALSPDGSEVVVVASPEGHPALFRVRGAEAPRPWVLPPGSPLPMGPNAPVVFGDALVFENETGVHSLGLDGSPRRSIPGVRHPVLSADGRSVLAHRDGALLRWTAGDLESVR